MKRINFILIFFFAFLSSVMASEKTTLTITVNGQQRSMIVYTPSQQTTNMPLMIITHGMGQSPEYQSVGDAPEYTGGDRLWELCDTAKFVCAYLRSDGSMWDTGGTKDIDFVNQTIDEMASRYSINQGRIYWSGFSMGSMLIYATLSKINSSEKALNLVNRIAAFAPTSGYQFGATPWDALTAKNKKINLIHHHSEGDTCFYWDGSNQQGVTPTWYITKVAEANGGTYTSSSFKSQEGDYTGTKEVWANKETGNEIVFIHYSQGGHWPSKYNRKEIWNFCKRFGDGAETTSFVDKKYNLVDLTSDNFFLWDKSTADAKTVSHINCELNLNTTDTNLIYGLSTVNYLSYTDLTEADVLLVTVNGDGSPRFLFNRIEDEGTVYGEITNSNNSSYMAVVDNGDGTKTYYVNVAQLVKDQGFAHLHAIKGNNWANINVTSIKCGKEIRLYSDLKASDFYNWTAADKSGVKNNNAGCAYDLGTPSTMPYGDGNVYYLNYADLSDLEELSITAIDGEPRLIFNRMVDNSTDFIELPRDKEEFETVTTNIDGSKTYTIDIAKIVENYGFAHLHTIKSVGGFAGTTTTITEIHCKKKVSLGLYDFNPNIWETGKYEYDESAGVGTFYAGQYGFGGWHNDGGFDVSGYKSITVTFDEPAINGTSFRLFKVNNYWTGEDDIIMTDCSGKSSVTVDIANVDDLYYIGFWNYGNANGNYTSNIKIKSVILTPKSHIEGDVNADGSVDIKDVTSLSDILIGKKLKTSRADINNNGNVSIADLYLLIDALNKK